MTNQSPTLVGRGVLTTPLMRSDALTARWGQTRSARTWLRPSSFVLLFLTLTLAHAAECCTIPVFRYALDRWQADAYRLEFPASALQTPAIADFFRNLGSDSPVNLEAKPGTGAEARLIFPHPEEATAPVVWSGTLTPASLQALTNSPARRELARRVLAGESVVWVLVESGDKAADDALAARVEKRLRYLEQVAILPRIDPNDPTSQLGPGPALRVKFSLLRIAGTSNESLLLKMLAGPKPDAALQSGAWLAAVFGRGRVLGAWPAGDFGDAEIEEVCLFLLGACSCQVKRQNPGWDLLMNVAWQEELTAIAEKTTATGTTPKPITTNSVALEPETVKIQPQAAAPAAAPERPWPLMWIAAGFALVMGVWLRQSGRP